MHKTTSFQALWGSRFLPKKASNLLLFERISMPTRIFGTILSSGIALMLFALPLRVEAGGSGLNTVVVINQASSNSCEVANYFIERRQVPPENVLRINWAGGNVSWM